MDTLLFLLMIAGAATVLGWYVHNEVRNAPGTAGFLAIRRDETPGAVNAADNAAAYRLRPRRARSSLSNLPDTENFGRYTAAAAGASYRAADRITYTERAAAYRERTRTGDGA